MFNFDLTARGAGSSVWNYQCLRENKVSSMAKQKVAKQKVSFSYSAPEAHSVMVVGDFTGWQQAPLTLKKDKQSKPSMTVRNLAWRG